MRVATIRSRKARLAVTGALMAAALTLSAPTPAAAQDDPNPGAITFTGSIIAFGKLQGTFSGKPLLLPARHWLNLAALVEPPDLFEHSPRHHHGQCVDEEIRVIQGAER